MNHLCIFLLLLPLAYLSQSSAVTIAGKSNVNTFKCVNDKLPVISPSSGSNLPNLSLYIVDFDCKNRLMTNDFRKTLNHTQYPTLHIRFLKLKKLSTSNYYQAIFEVKLMNNKKTYEITLFKEATNLVGTKRMNFSDFNIVPPSRLGGKIKVKDALDLSVSLSLNP